MPASKTHDISIKVDEYTGSDNKPKSRNRTIGKLMRAEDGRPFIVINAECLSTQLFALARRKGEDAIILNCWESEKETTKPPAAQAPAADDEIPY